MGTNTDMQEITAYSPSNHAHRLKERKKKKTLDKVFIATQKEVIAKCAYG